LSSRLLSQKQLLSGTRLLLCSIRYSKTVQLNGCTDLGKLSELICPFITIRGQVQIRSSSTLSLFGRHPDMFELSRKLAQEIVCSSLTLRVQIDKKSSGVGRLTCKSRALH
jgi:hypothetical protein